MDTTHPQWEQYQEKFQELAFLADKTEAPEKPLDECQYYLCLYGENGLKESDELTMLEKMEPFVGSNLKKIEVETAYWQDTVLYVP